jgi:hypothetical protein
MAEEQKQKGAGVDGAGAPQAPEPEAKAQRIRAEEAKPGDRIVDRDGLQDPITVTRVEFDGGFMFVYGGPRPVQMARGEWIRLLPPEPQADDENVDAARPDEEQPERD